MKEFFTIIQSEDPQTGNISCRDCEVDSFDCPYSKTIVHDKYHEYQTPSEKCPGEGNYQLIFKKMSEKS